MSLFKNGVGRPSNDTLRKRKVFIISAIAVVAVLAGIGIYFGVRFARGDMSSGLFNLESSPVSIKIEATNATAGKVLGTYKNQEVYLSGWRNYAVGFNIKASTTNGSIKSIVVTYNDYGYNTTAKAEASINNHKKTINGNIGYFDFTGDGIRVAKVTATDDKGKSRTIKVRTSIDRTAPTVKFSISGKKQSNGSYPSGSVIKATCTDSISGVTYMYTFDAQDKADYRKYDSSAVSSKAHSITMVTTGSKRYITTACKDKAGNSTGNKNSTAYGIGVKPASSSSPSSDSTGPSQQIIDTITGQKNPRVTVTAINLSNNSTIKTTKSGSSILLDGWRNYKVRFKVAATSPESGTTIKSIKWNYNAAGITSTSKSNYMTWVVRDKTFNGASANLDFTAEGARRGSVVVTDSKGRTTVFQIGANIDLTKPKVGGKWISRTKVGVGAYYTGAVAQATCSDSLSGVKGTTAYEGLNPKNYSFAYGSNARVTLYTAGTNYLKGECVDNAGNKATKNGEKLTFVAKATTVTISYVSGNPSSWTNKNVTLKVTANASAGLHSKAYSFDGGSTWQASSSKTFSSNKTVKIVVRDKNGKKSATKTVKITKIDKTAPTITLSMQARQEERGKYPNGAGVLVKCSDSASGVTYLYGHENSNPNNNKSSGSKSGSGVSSRSLTINLRIGGSGRKVYAQCYDKAGNYANKYSTGWTILK